MQNINPQKYFDANYTSAEQLKAALEQEKGTTTDIVFILSIRDVLLDADFSVTDVDSMLWKLMREHESIVHDVTDMSLFLMSCRLASVIWFNRLVDKADLTATDKAGYEAARHAIMGGSLIIVKSLADKGVDFSKPSKDGTSYLLDAARSRNPKIFEWLVENESDEELLKTAFMDFIVRHENTDLVEMMINKGFDYKACRIEHNNHSMNALEAVLFSKQYDTAQLLINSGMCIDGSQMPTSFSLAKASTLINGLCAEKDRASMSMPEKIESNLAEMLIKNAVNEDNELIYPLINLTNSNLEIKRLFAVTEINPALDVNISQFEDEIQDRIYEIMFV